MAIRVLEKALKCQGAGMKKARTTKSAQACSKVQ
jgi:hypothetical protein